jgi:CubicO group peptidase (beta-lactamase class C family)
MHETSSGRATLANWRTAPFSRRAFHHVREILPTAEIAANRDAPEYFTSAPRDISGVTFEGIGGEETTVGQILADSFTDGFVVLQGREIVCEWYNEGYDPACPHIVFSVSKSIIACLAGILADRGLIDPDALAVHYIPEAKGSAYGDCTVRHILDMTVDMDFEESYLNPDGDYARYREATGWNPPVPRDEPLDQNSFLLSLRRGPGEHGKSFAYMSPNSDFLGWLLERVGGKPLAELLSEHIWRPMGARDAAYVSLDRLGMARGAGGICATARDLALFGAMMRDGGKAAGRQVIPAGWVADIRTGGDRDPWINGDPAYYELLPEGGYRSKWYQTGNEHGAFCAIGIHGQWIYVDPAADAVIVRLASQPEPLDDPLDKACLRAFGAICRALA